jgi:hypothetical protein
MWTTKTEGEYSYCMKRYETGSMYGIGGEGRISKLEIRKGNTALYRFERGLDFDRLDEGGRALYERLLAEYN